VGVPAAGDGLRLGDEYRRLRVRYERRDDIHEAFLAIGCSLICLKLLTLDAPPALLGSPR
jgi:hypothetical protein